MQVKAGISRPGPNLPKIFTHIDRGMKKAITLEALTEAGIVGLAEPIDKGWVESMPITYGGIDVAVKGFTDRMFLNTDGTVTIFEFKTSVLAEKWIARYKRQVGAYAYAVEYPRDFSPRKVSRCYLVAFDATAGNFKFSNGAAAQTGALVIQPVEYSSEGFEATLEACAAIASLPLPPDPYESCEHCAFANRIANYRRQLQEAA